VHGSFKPEPAYAHRRRFRHVRERDVKVCVVGGLGEVCRRRQIGRVKINRDAADENNSLGRDLCNVGAQRQQASKFGFVQPEAPVPGSWPIIYVRHGDAAVFPGS
jgi:hypothetical protein